MDSIDSLPPAAPSNMLAVDAPTVYSPSNTNSMIASSTIGLNPPATAQMMPPSARFSFTSMIAPASVPLDSIAPSPYEGSHSGSYNVDSVKKKRGRPRKYAPDGNISLGLATSVAHDDLSVTLDSQNQPKKARGRPRGSGKKQDAFGLCDIGCTPHILFAKPGEDVAAKILSFLQLELGQRTVFIISANGTISNVTLRHPEASGGCVSYEGQYEIITLTGSFLVSENNGTESRIGGLNVLLAGTAGQVLGGGVAGMLMAGSQVQVIVGSFVGDDKKPYTSSMLNTGFSSGAPSQMMNFGGGTAAAASSPPLGVSSGESSAENGGSPLNNNNRHPGVFDNNGQAIQMQQQQQQMYHHHQIWPASQTQQ